MKQAIVSALLLFIAGGVREPPPQSLAIVDPAVAPNRVYIDKSVARAAWARSLEHGKHDVRKCDTYH